MCVTKLYQHSSKLCPVTRSTWSHCLNKCWPTVNPIDYFVTIWPNFLRGKGLSKSHLLNWKTYPPVSISVSHRWSQYSKVKRTGPEANDSVRVKLHLTLVHREIICIPQCLPTVLNRVSDSPLICCFNTLDSKIIVKQFRHLMIWVTTLQVRERSLVPICFMYFLTPGWLSLRSVRLIEDPTCRFRFFLYIFTIAPWRCEIGSSTDDGVFVEKILRHSGSRLSNITRWRTKRYNLYNLHACIA